MSVRTEPHNLTVPAWEKPTPITAPPLTVNVKPGKGKKYAANVFRRAAKLLEEHPDRHVNGYGHPFADKPENQCFCAVAAIDMVLEADGLKSPNITGHIEYGSNVNGQPLLHAPPGRLQEVYSETSGARSLYGFNDDQPVGRERVAFHMVLTEEGSKNVVKLMRRVAARLEHGGQLRSPKKAGASNG